MTIRRQHISPQIKKGSCRAFRVDVSVSSYTDYDATVRTHVSTKIHFSHGVFMRDKKPSKTTQYLMTKSAGMYYRTRPSYAFIIEPSNGGLTVDVISKFRNPSGVYDKGGPYHKATNDFLRTVVEQCALYSASIGNYDN